MWKCYYFEGEFPEDEDQALDMDACVVSETSNCDTKYNITVKNCGEYYTYKLSPTNANEAFCFSKLNKDLPFANGNLW